jgi:hypothetical protein
MPEVILPFGFTERRLEELGDWVHTDELPVSWHMERGFPSLMKILQRKPSGRSLKTSF